MVIDRSNNPSASHSQLHRDALSIASETIASLSPDRLVADRLSGSESEIVVDGTSYSLPADGRVFVVGAGKGAQPLVEAVLDRLDVPVESPLVVEKRGQASPSNDCTVLEADHPVPSKSSRRAGDRFLELAENASEEDIVICCITGGASSLVVSPVGIELSALRETTQTLLEAGVGIEVLNAVRKHVSAIKGGQLALEFAPATVISLIVVDEIGGQPWGPTVPDESTYLEAIDGVKRSGCWTQIPRSVRSHLTDGARGTFPETPTESDLESVVGDRIVLATARDLCSAAASIADDAGYPSLVLSTSIEGESADVGMVHGAIAREVREAGQPMAPPCALISGGETTVTVSNPDGTGGPNQETALGFASVIAGYDDVVGVFLDTDGTDGPTTVAGGIVDGTTAAEAATAGRDIETVLRSNDATELLTTIDRAISFSEPGVNLMDFRLVLIG